MDVQTESTDPPPGESQSRGKIRKGFKLFGKRKPGNIFSLRSKGDGNNKSPVTRSSTVDGLSPDSEQEQERENGQEESQGEREQEEEETLCEDGVLAAAAARASISSASSAKSLSFLSLLRGGRRGTGGRRVRTVSQPAGRQRRGLKGLFGNVKFRSKDTEEEEAPPSPLLMSSRANSVEIIKEDLVLTPKPQHRSLDSPETESCEPDMSLTPQDSACTSPSETLTPKGPAGRVSRTNEHVPPLPTSEPPLVPGDNSLSCLLADISSLLTFDSITGGGDIMADVEAEWGKASSPVNAVAAEFTASSTSVFSKPTISSPVTSASAKPSPVAVPTTASTQSVTPLTRTTTTSSPVAKPSSIVTTFTKSSTLTAHSVKLSSDTRGEASPSAMTKLTPAAVTTKPSTTPVTLTSFSSPIMSLPSVPIKSTLSSTYTAPTAPPNVVKAPSISPTLTCSVSKRESEVTAPPQVITSVSKPVHVATPAPASAKPPPVTHSPPTPVAFTQPPSAKLDSASSLNLQISTSYKPSLTSAAGEPKTQVTVSPPSAVTTKPLFPAPAPPSKGTTVPIPITTSGSVSAAHSKPTPTSSPTELNKNPPSLVIAQNKYPSSTPSATSRTQACLASQSSVLLDTIPPMTKHIPATVSSDKTPPAPISPPAPIAHAVVPTAFPATPAPAQIAVPQSKEPPASAKTPISVFKDPPAHAQVSPVTAQILIHASTDPPAPAQMQVPHSKAPPALALTPISVTKPPPLIAPIPASVSKNPPAPAHLPLSTSTDLPAPVRNPVSASKDPPAQNTVSQSKAPPATSPALCPVTSPPSTPSPPAAWSSPAPASAEARECGQASVDEQLISPSSTCVPGAQTTLSKTEELHNESRTSLSRESRIPLVKASGLSKIPVVGGGRGGKPPVRDSQHVDGAARRDPPTPVLEEERPRFHSHDAGSKDKIADFEVDVPTSRQSQEESQQPPQTKLLTSLPRDSKIPVKHGAQSHTASHVPQAKEPSRTKIPVSKVPVRRAGNKAVAAAGGIAQMRK
ncbi:uncharacterized protein LOC120821577 [Gasterosteus aculeatus]